MRNVFSIFILVALFVSSVRAQEITTTITGSIVDQATGQPLADINIRMDGAGNSFTAQSNESGKFSVTVPVGRYKLTASSTGYTSQTTEILATAGKAFTINLPLVPSVQQLQEVEVASTPMSNELAGQRSLTIEKTLRIPANYLDPVRALTAYPGVVVANDQGNSIIVRGNSPNGLVWKLNGVDIVNPNHLSNAGTFSDKPMANGGGVNIISSQVINNTDFYTGQVPIAYGNSLAGIIDMNLREGNKSNFEYTAQASLIGLDFAAEGPIGKGENTSILANYRYSTVGLLSSLGVDFGDETIAFQDFSFHLNHRNNKGLVFSLFGFWGASKNEFDAKPSDEWEEEKDQYNIDYKSNTAAIGANVSIPVKAGKLWAGLAYSSTSQTRDARMTPEAFFNQVYVVVDDYDQSNGLLSARIDYAMQLGKNINWTIGVNSNLLDNSVDALKQYAFSGIFPIANNTLQGKNDGILLQPYSSVDISLSPSISLNAGVRYVHYTYNSTSALEPRAALQMKTSQTSSISASYGLISQVQLPQLYALSKDLELTKSHHFDLSHAKTFANDIKLTTGLYYQALYDVPVGDRDLFSALNFLEGLPYGEMRSEGTGKNYGFDVTADKQFFNDNYILLGGSYYKSTYVAQDGVERNTRFDGNYTFSAVHGKEWTKESKRRTISLNSRLLYLGGMRETPVLENESRFNGETFYGGEPYSEKLEDYFRLDLRLSFRKNKPGYTRTFAIDIQNLTNQQNEAYQYYDRVQAKTMTKYHLGIIPLLVYRIDF